MAYRKRDSRRRYGAMRWSDIAIQVLDVYIWLIFVSNTFGQIIPTLGQFSAHA